MPVLFVSSSLSVCLPLFLLPPLVICQIANIVFLCPCSRCRHQKRRRERGKLSHEEVLGSGGSRDKHVTTPTEGKLHEPMGRGQYHEPEFIGPDGTHIMEGYSTDVITDMTLHFIKRRDQSKPRHVPP